MNETRYADAPRVSTPVRAARRLFGTVETGPDTVRIGGLLSSTVIPYARITSVNTNMVTGSVTIETGAQTHEVKLWNPLKVAPLAAAIREGLAYFLTRPSGGPFAPPGTVRVDDGGPTAGEYRKRDGIV